MSDRKFDIPRPEVLGRQTSELPDSPGEPAHAQNRMSEILDKHTGHLMQLPGVVTVGEGQDEVGRDAIIIGVKTTSDLSGLPKSIEGFPVRATVIGDVDAL